MEKVVEWAEKLKGEHRPSDLLTLPDFMKPKARAVEPHTAVAPQVIPLPATSAAVEPIVTQAKRLICAQCGVKISYAEGKFCWNNEKRFGGLQYCREHQATSPR